MLESCKSAQERWGGVSELIENWLEERRILLVLYCSISGVKEPEDKRPLQIKISSLCEVLMDYVSVGHFEIFEQLHQEALAFNDSAAIEKSQSILENIQKTTDLCVAFNDQAEYVSDIPSLELAVSKLGMVLEQRFALEDQAIEILHNAHKEIMKI